MSILPHEGLQFPAWELQQQSMMGICQKASVTNGQVLSSLMPGIFQVFGRARLAFG